MIDQRPLMRRRSREDPSQHSRIRANRQPCALASETSRFRCRDAARTGRPTRHHIFIKRGHLSLVHGAARPSMLIGASLLKIVPRGSAAVAFQTIRQGSSGWRTDAPQSDLCFLKNCERCQIAHSRTAAVRFETSSAMRNLAKFVGHHQKLKQAADVGTAVATAMQQH